MSACNGNVVAQKQWVEKRPIAVVDGVVGEPLSFDPLDKFPPVARVTAEGLPPGIEVNSTTGLLFGVPSQGNFAFIFVECVSCVLF